ncbi:hypothetical protein EJB05_09257, partial [Eragrostis curvula]
MANVPVGLYPNVAAGESEEARLGYAEFVTGGQMPPELTGLYPGSLCSYEHQHPYACQKAHHYGAGDTDKSDRDEGSFRQQQPNDREYVRRCLAAKRPTASDE